MARNFKHPVPTVDIIIETARDGVTKIVLIKRKFPPYGWAIPGGFVEYGESLENAAVREAKEETGLDVTLIRQFHAYSDPVRDPRRHSIAVVFIARAEGDPVGMDDAAEAKLFLPNQIPDDMAFDHGQIIEDYFKKRY
jgi:8-oxo-dGTP diphosphatase